MGRLSRGTAGDRTRTIGKIAGAVLCALIAGSACIGMLLLFFSAGYLPGPIRVIVILLCVIGLIADFLLARSYINGLLDELDE